MDPISTPMPLNPISPQCRCPQSDFTWVGVGTKRREQRRSEKGERKEKREKKKYACGVRSERVGNKKIFFVNTFQLQ